MPPYYPEYTHPLYHPGYTHHPGYTPYTPVRGTVRYTAAPGRARPGDRALGSRETDFPGWADFFALWREEVSGFLCSRAQSHSCARAGIT